VKVSEILGCEARMSKCLWRERADIFEKQTFALLLKDLRYANTSSDDLLREGQRAALALRRAGRHTALEDPSLGPPDSARIAERL
jgi:hypothetical protein